MYKSFFVKNASSNQEFLRIYIPVSKAGPASYEYSMLKISVTLKVWVKTGRYTSTTPECKAEPVRHAFSIIVKIKGFVKIGRDTSITHNHYQC